MIELTFEGTEPGEGLRFSGVRDLKQQIPRRSLSLSSGAFPPQRCAQDAERRAGVVELGAGHGVNDSTEVLGESLAKGVAGLSDVCSGALGAASCAVQDGVQRAVS